MPQTNSRDKSVEWACRTILTVHFWLVLAGYVVFLQAKNQLESPIIPKDIIAQISTPYWKISLAEAVLFIVSLWFYFLSFRVVVLILSSIAVVSYWVVTTYFLHLI